MSLRKLYSAEGFCFLILIKCSSQLSICYSNVLFISIEKWLLSVKENLVEVNFIILYPEKVQ